MSTKLAPQQPQPTYLHRLIITLITINFEGNVINTFNYKSTTTATSFVARLNRHSVATRGNPNTQCTRF